jgi:hypothetical protein
MGDLYLLLELNRDPGLREALGKMLELPPPNTSSRAPSLQEVKDAGRGAGQDAVSQGADTRSISTSLRARAAKRRRRDALGEVGGDGGGPAAARRVSRSRSRFTRAIPPWPSASRNGCAGPPGLREANDAKLLVVTPGIDADDAIDGWLASVHAPCDVRRPNPKARQHR